MVGQRLFMPPIRLLTQENPEPGCPRSLGLRIQRPGQLSGQQQRAISTKFGNSTLSCLHTQHFHRSDFLESTLVITIKRDASKLKEGLWDCVSCVKSGNTLFPSAPRAFDSPPPNIEHRERCSLLRFVRLHIRHQQWQHHCEFLPE